MEVKNNEEKLCDMVNVSCETIRDELQNIMHLKPFEQKISLLEHVMYKIRMDWRMIYEEAKRMDQKKEGLK